MGMILYKKKKHQSVWERVEEEFEKAKKAIERQRKYDEEWDEIYREIKKKK